MYDGDRNYEGKKFEDDDPNMDDGNKNSHEENFFEDNDTNIDNGTFDASK
eukprot:CAMPEP_0194341624 /NCGR_PEP_ID=MMETSP0171-20130528/90279_1 /TAXON_ID=218684 /ORGANISM="Corethron pennatum, Strain L29A3" /LENGTH=49 /DNA_ID=CAMNT_0039107033 /DNA_START=192 /DNA_END=341 /DNA_ORIENTATION=-